MPLPPSHWVDLNSDVEIIFIATAMPHAKGQEISEWKFEVVALPKIWTSKFEKFCPKYSGQNFSNFFVHIFILKFADLYAVFGSWKRHTVLLPHAIIYGQILAKSCRNNFTPFCYSSSLIQCHATPTLSFPFFLSFFLLLLLHLLY